MYASGLGSYTPNFLMQQRMWNRFFLTPYHISIPFCFSFLVAVCLVSTPLKPVAGSRTAPLSSSLLLQSVHSFWAGSRPKQPCGSASVCCGSTRPPQQPFSSLPITNCLYSGERGKERTDYCVLLHTAKSHRKEENNKRIVSSLKLI